MNNATSTLIAIWTGLLGLAMVAVIVSQKAQTSNILQALGTASASSIGAAIAPLTSQNTLSL